MTIPEILVVAQAASGSGTPSAPNALVQMFPLILIFVLFYFVLIRPQQKRQKEHQKLISALKTGDHVVTSSGIHGMIANVKDRTVIIRIAENVKVEFDRSAVAVVLKADSEAPAANP